MIGASSLPDFDARHLARGGAIVVTPNYRLGVEGFASIDGAPATRGPARPGRRPVVGA
ncbi:hypothetical protein ACFXCZ_31755 [Streptomyces sp. NPDC059396]|uniref:hypothetical protein n=1 Tax=Streptomyces sp. NPDC059396 TaxID=3346819 RepID=UPI0036C3F21C